MTTPDRERGPFEPERASPVSRRTSGGRRQRWALVGDLLGVIDLARRSHEPVPLSTVAARANLPYDRAVALITDLSQRGLLEPGTKAPALTAAGREYLRAYQEWRSTLGRFGFRE